MDASPASPPAKLKDLSAPEALSLLAANPALRIVDVRTPAEFHAGHIEGALLAPLGKTARSVDGWPVTTPILLVCHSGHRSHVAGTQLLRLGFQDVSHIAGGMIAWKRSGAPLTRE